MLRAYGVTDKGRVRPTNEDCYGIDEELRLCIVADGMGGHNAGEVASSIAVQAIIKCVRTATIDSAWPFGFDPSVSATGNLLATAVHVANQQVFDLASATPSYAGMGTTIVAVQIRKGMLSIAHAGDSRLYLFNDGELRQVTEDDSWLAAVLSQDPKADLNLLKQHPMRHALTNVVGSRPKTTVHVREMALKGGERLVMTTDGVHGSIETLQLTRLVENADDPRDLATSLVDVALASGSRDNCTAIVADYAAE
jgi:serine/threonine protein phosphatase PrpC